MINEEYLSETFKGELLVLYMRIVKSITMETSDKMLSQILVINNAKNVH